MKKTLSAPRPNLASLLRRDGAFKRFKATASRELREHDVEKPHKPAPLGQIWPSRTICNAPVAACLIAAERAVNLDSKTWTPKSPDQWSFLEGYYWKSREQVTNLPEIKSEASHDVRIVNKFLRDQGFRIKLDPTSPGHLAVAAVMKLTCTWKKKGQKVMIRDGVYHAAKLTEDVCIEETRHLPNPVAHIRTTNGDRVWMSPLPEIKEKTDLEDLIRKVVKSRAHPTGRYNGVVFPMVSYDEEVNLSWLVGMKARAGGDPWQIEEAVQQIKFDMNEIGAKVRSAVAMSGAFTAGLRERSKPKPPFIIDQPFLLWITRPEADQPLFIAHFTPASWKKAQ